jgi:hypothetical protein
MSFVLMHGRCQAHAMPITESLTSQTRAAADFDDTVIIRVAVAADAPALARLAALDAARPLHGQILLAESGGVALAALSLDDDRTAADPFRPTAGHVALLRTRADLLRGERSRRRLRRVGDSRRPLTAGG